MENLKAIIVFLLFWSIAIWCVRVGVMWAADVVYGYAQEAKGKESKRVTEAISDWVLDTAKQ